MFSSPARLKERTPANGVGREEYLGQLVDEYIQTTSKDAKEQVLANLANFAYDPVNYEFIRNVGMLDIFLHVLKQDTDVKLRHFACAGVCNCCLDPLNADHIVQYGGLVSLVAALDSDHPETLADVIVSLIYLTTDQTKHITAADSVVQTILRLKDFDDKRVSNVAIIYLNDIANMKIEE